MTAAIDRLESDRERGASALAIDAVEILATAPQVDRAALAERIALLRPGMPAIGSIARHAARLDDPNEVLVQVEAEHRHVADHALTLMTGVSSVATISNSSLVERLLLRGRPDRTSVAVTGEADEGHLLVGRLRHVGLDALAVAMSDLDAEVAIVGSDAIFDDGGFVNRVGTAALVARFASRRVIVLGDHWRHVAGPTPRRWPEPELLELVVAAPNLVLVDGRPGPGQIQSIRWKRM
jgi:translation initiation factor 2B subunit (eIF-2B alpha/beta/delta family)